MPGDPWNLTVGEESNSPSRELLVPDSWSSLSSYRSHPPPWPSPCPYAPGTRGSAWALEVGSPSRGSRAPSGETRDALCPTCTGPHPPHVQCPGRPLALPSPWEASGRSSPNPRARGVTAPDNQNLDGAGSGGTSRRDRRTYLEQPESGHPADAALLVLRAQHPQLLCLLQDFVWLLKEVKEDVVSVPEPIRSPPRAQADWSCTHTHRLAGRPHRGPSEPPRPPRGLCAPQGRTHPHTQEISLHG